MAIRFSRQRIFDFLLGFAVCCCIPLFAESAKNPVNAEDYGGSVSCMSCAAEAAALASAESDFEASESAQQAWDNCSGERAYPDPVEPGTLASILER